MQVAGLRQVCTYLLRARAANARGMTRLISISVLLLNSASCVAGVWAAPRPHLSVAGQSSQRARHGSLLRRGVGADGRGGAGAAASPRLQPGKRISFKPNAFFNGKRITMHRCRRSRCGGGGAAVASSRLQPVRTVQPMRLSMCAWCILLGRVEDVTASVGLSCPAAYSKSLNPQVTATSARAKWDAPAEDNGAAVLMYRCGCVVHQRDRLSFI